MQEFYCFIDPTSYTQKIYYGDQDASFLVAEPSTENFINTIKELMYQRNIYKVNFVDNYSYSKGMADILENEFLLYYSSQPLEIKFINSNE